MHIIPEPPTASAETPFQKLLREREASKAATARKSSAAPPAPADDAGVDRLRAVAALFDEAEEQRAGGWLALCPAHDDSTPSLAIDPGKDGRILVRCRAGCATADVLAAVGLSFADLAAGATTPLPDPRTWTARPEAAPDAGVSKKKTAAPKTQGRIAATYRYVDEGGKLLFEVLRKEPKGFLQRRPAEGGGWDWKLGDVRRVLYRLPELIAADSAEPVFVVEGEKDADRLAALGLVATTNPGGAGKWRSDYNDALSGRTVVLLPDNDAAGRKHAEDVASALTGVAASVRVVELPGLPEKGDASDWVDAGGDADALWALVEPVDEYAPANSIIKITVAEPSSDAHDTDDNSIIKITVAEPPVLGEEAYYSLAGDFLRAVAPHTEATDAGVLAHLLPAVGMLVGGGLYVWAGTKQPARINAVLVGPTNAGRKGTSFAPVDILGSRVDGLFWSAQRVNGLSSGEGLIAYVADKEEETDDGQKLMVEAEKRLLVVEEEFSRVLSNTAREGNVLSQVLRSAFDSGDLTTLTVIPRHAAGAHISIVGHITPEELKAKLTAIEMANGFGNRFLWILVRSDKIMSRTNPLPAKVFEPLVAHLQALLKYGSTTSSRAIPLSPAAADLWDTLYPQLRVDRPGLAGAMVARGSAIVLRLALIYSLFDRKKVESLRIEPVHLLAAMAVWRYGEASAQALFGGITGDPLGDKILELLRTRGPMTRDDFNDHMSAKQKRAVGGSLAALEAAKRIRKTRLTHEGAGRPADRYELAN